MAWRKRRRKGKRKEEKEGEGEVKEEKEEAWDVMPLRRKERKQMPNCTGQFVTDFRQFAQL